MRLAVEANLVDYDEAIFFFIYLFFSQRDFSAVQPAALKSSQLVGRGNPQHDRLKRQTICLSNVSSQFCTNKTINSFICSSVLDPAIKYGLPIGTEC